MPILKTVTGNLITMFKNGDFNEIAHGVNCHHAMGSGIAPQIANAYPEVRKCDNDTQYGDHNKLGKCFFTSTKDGIVVNMYTQFYPGKEDKTVLYNSIRQCFKQLNSLTKKPVIFQDLEKDDYWTLGIPMIGSGIAGGNWNVIEKIINEVTPNIRIILVKWDGS